MQRYVTKVFTRCAHDRGQRCLCAPTATTNIRPSAYEPNTAPPAASASRDVVSSAPTETRFAVLLRGDTLTAATAVVALEFADADATWLGAVGVGRSGVRQRRAAELSCTAVWVNMKFSTQVLCL